MANNQNLRPIKKGEIRNPKGKPRGITFKGLMTKLLDGSMTIEQDGKKLTKTRREVLVMTLLKDALDTRNSAGERIKANTSIQDRVEGKPDQPITHQGASITLVVSPEDAEL